MYREQECFSVKAVGVCKMTDILQDTLKGTEALADSSVDEKLKSKDLDQEKIKTLFRLFKAQQKPKV